MRTSNIIALLLALGLMVTVSACGGSENGSEANETPTTEAAPAETSTTEAAPVETPTTEATPAN